MKNILYPLLLLLLAISCSPADEISPEPFKPGTLVPAQAIGQWKLVKMIWRTQIAGQPDTNYPLPYDETLTLHSDSTVTRYRNGVKATGTFSITNSPISQDWFVNVKFDDPSVAFHTFGNYNHTFDQGMGLWNGEAEYLLFDYSTADGPTAYYQKVTEAK